MYVVKPANDLINTYNYTICKQYVFKLFEYGIGRSKSLEIFKDITIKFSFDQHTRL